MSRPQKHARFWALNEWSQVIGKAPFIIQEEGARVCISNLSLRKACTVFFHAARTCGIYFTSHTEPADKIKVVWCQHWAQEAERGSAKTLGIRRFWGTTTQAIEKVTSWTILSKLLVRKWICWSLKFLLRLPLDLAATISHFRCVHFCFFVLMNG